MIRLFLFCALFVGAVFPVCAQDYMTTIAEKACSCLDKPMDGQDQEMVNAQLGLCMIDAALPYQKQIKKDYGIDMNNIDKEGEKLGRVIGLKVATVCPDKLAKIAQSRKENKKAETAEVFELEGMISKIEKDFFVNFAIKDETGKITKCYWLTAIATETDLTNYQSLEGRAVTISYTNQELFDARIGEYRKFAVIQSLEVQD